MIVTVVFHRVRSLIFKGPSLIPLHLSHSSLRKLLVCSQDQLLQAGMRDGPKTVQICSISELKSIRHSLNSNPYAALILIPQCSPAAHMSSPLVGTILLLTRSNPPLILPLNLSKHS
jgi:hypothetical protein